LAFALLIGWDVAGPDKRLTIGAVLLLGTLVVVARPVWSIGLLVVATFVLNWVPLLLADVPTSIAWLQEAALLGLIAAVAVNVAQRGSWRHSAADKWMLLLVAVGAVGALANVLSPFVAALGMRNYWKYLILFCALVQIDLGERALRRLVMLLAAVSAVQVPVAVAQRLLYETRSGDVVGGTLGPNSSGALTILMLGMAALALAWYLQTPQGQSWLLVLVGVLLLPAALNETKVLFFAGPIVFALVLWRGSSGRVAKGLLAGVVIAAAIVASYQAYQVMYGLRGGGTQIFSRAFLQSYLATDTAEGGVLNRLPAGPFALGEIANEVGTFLFGFGPGSASESVFGGIGSGPIFEKYATLKLDSSFIARFTLESGMMGWVALLGLLATIAGAARVVLVYAQSHFWRGVALGMEGWLILMLGLTVYTSTFTVDALAVSFWLLAGAITRVSLQLRDRTPGPLRAVESGG
jgi:hypothetical protein